MTQTIGQKIAERFAEKMAPKGATESLRPDLYVADFERSGRDSSKVLVGWAHGLGVPANPALDNFVLAQFEGQLKLKFDTLRIHPKQRLATFVVDRMLPTRRLADVDGLLKVGPTRFVEADTKAVWEVREGDDGGKHLVMLQADNLDALLEERRRAVKVRKGSVPTFAKVKGEGNRVVDAGDRIKCYHSGLLKQATVMAIQPNGDYKVKLSPEGGFATIVSAAIIDLVQKDPRTVDDQKDRVRAYWTKIYGKDYVEKWLGKTGA